MKTYCELCKCWYDENNQKTSPPEEDVPIFPLIKDDPDDLEDVF